MGTTAIDYLPWVKIVVRMGMGISWNGYQSCMRLDDTKGTLHLECLKNYDQGRFLEMYIGEINVV